MQGKRVFFPANKILGVTMGTGSVRTVRDAWEFYYTSVLLSTASPGTINSDKSRWLLHIEPILGNKQICDIVKADYIKLRRNIEQKKLSSQTVHHVLSLLRRILNAMITWEVYEGKSIPSFKNVMPKFDNRRIRFLSIREANILLEQFKKYEKWHDIVLFDLHTGLRKDEIFNLTFSNVNFDKKILFIVDTKTNKNRSIPLNDTAINIILKKKSKRK